MGAHAHPEITMHTFPLSKYMCHIECADWRAVADLMIASGEKLATAGADFLICPDNTIHQAHAMAQAGSRRPWLNIAEEVAKVAASKGFSKLGILGTRYLMEGPVYPQKLDAHGIEHQIPGTGQRLRINEIIFEELVYGKLETAARRYFSSVIDDLKALGCDAVVLGCTEIPLLIAQEDSALPILDSTRILARAALQKATEPATSQSASI